MAGRVVLVVGGTGLVGTAVVDRLRAEGATAVAASRSGRGGLVLDARDKASVAAGISTVIEEHGQLDGVVVAAAPSAQTLDSARNSDPEQVLEAVDAKASGFLRLANAALDVMSRAGYGRIVGVAGQNAFLTGNVAGSVRNAALIIAAKNLADSVAGTGVTVNTVSPGVVRDDAHTDVVASKAGEVRPSEVADLIAFLVSPVASAISGESIAVGHRVRGVTSM
ncbi:short-chain dehydrogenase/reductase SDR [Arthrobacter crystallopoietes BAB-32]|uniref:Short-chain dehydrogenase/reductase SDR n=1 Tax=Arthrobacter crystallopoietes BAB-32 TaxID=1246476 RepID=N1V641_9MICC|nr:short-chain dehydrogenase/reductase SDR [Arthrobacter crystallopoietes BAB-32]